MTGLNGTSEETRMLEPSMQPTLKVLDNEVKGLRRLDHDSADLIVFPLRAHSYFARLKERQGSYQCLVLADFLHILKPCFGKRGLFPPRPVVWLAPRRRSQISGNRPRKIVGGVLITIKQLLQPRADARGSASSLPPIGNMQSSAGAQHP